MYALALCFRLDAKNCPQVDGEVMTRLEQLQLKKSQKTENNTQDRVAGAGLAHRGRGRSRGRGRGGRGGRGRGRATASADEQPEPTEEEIWEEYYKHCGWAHGPGEGSWDGDGWWWSEDNAHGWGNAQEIEEPPAKKTKAAAAKPKGVAKPKGKAKAKAAQKGGRKRASNEDEPAQEEHHEDDIEENPAKKKCMEADDNEEGTEPGKATFARRYKPEKRAFQGARWEALREAFTSHLAPVLEMPSSHEANTDVVFC